MLMNVSLHSCRCKVLAYHKVQVDAIQAQSPERRLDCLPNASVPSIV
jgi:hypothetical protein